MRLIDVMLYSEATNLSTTPAVAYALIGINCVVAVVTKRVDTVSVVVNAGILRLDQRTGLAIARGGPLQRTLGVGTTAEIEDAVERLRKMQLVVDRSIMVSKGLGG